MKDKGSQHSSFKKSLRSERTKRSYVRSMAIEVSKIKQLLSNPDRYGIQYIYFIGNLDKQLSEKCPAGGFK